MTNIEDTLKNYVDIIMTTYNFDISDLNLIRQFGHDIAHQAQLIINKERSNNGI